MKSDDHEVMVWFLKPNIIIYLQFNMTTCRGHRAHSEVGAEWQCVNSCKLAGSGGKFFPNLSPLNIAENALEILKMSCFCERFIFWNGYVCQENQWFGPRCPKVGGSSPPAPPHVRSLTWRSVIWIIWRWTRLGSLPSRGHRTENYQYLIDRFKLQSSKFVHSIWHPVRNEQLNAGSGQQPRNRHFKWNFQVCQNPAKLRKPTCVMWQDVPVLFFPKSTEKRLDKQARKSTPIPPSSLCAPEWC